MATALLSLREDYWEEYELEDEDISFLYEYLLESETPLTSEELMPILVESGSNAKKFTWRKNAWMEMTFISQRSSMRWEISLFSRLLNGKKVRLLDSEEGENPA